MQQGSIALYRLLSLLPWPHGLAGRVMLACGICTHLPLVAVLWLWFMQAPGSANTLNLPLLAVFGATLGGTALALAVIQGLLAPLRITSAALGRYLSSGELPNLPEGFEDEGGRLMARTRETLESLDQALATLRQTAATDPLTGLANRRWLRERGEEMLREARRAGGELAVVLFDVDHFKTINDRYGHTAGDRALVAIGRVAARLAGPDDLVTRHGGEEFCLLLPGRDAAAARAAAEAMRRAVERVEVEGLPPRAITASFGVATLAPSDAHLDEMIDRADRRLYAAKRGGRNMVVSGEEILPTAAE